ncbi:MAG: DUF6468 domain-containing protein [Rickettsiales bacterium]
MTAGLVGIILNLAIIVLLLATISYCWILNKRIRILQDGKSELAKLLKHFDESTTRASDTIITLQSASKKIGENMQSRIDRAGYVIDDLSFMVEKGNNIIEKMEANLAVDRARGNIVPERFNKEYNDEDSKERRDYKNQDFSDEYDVADDGDTISKKAIKIIDKISARDKTAASLEAVLGRRSNENRRSSDESVKNKIKRKAKTSSRTRAEKELLDMIRSGIKG